MLIMPQPQSLHELSQQCSTTVRSFSVFRRDASGQRNNWHNHPLCFIRKPKTELLESSSTYSGLSLSAGLYNGERHQKFSRAYFLFKQRAKFINAVVLQLVFLGLMEGLSAMQLCRSYIFANLQRNCCFSPSLSSCVLCPTGLHLHALEKSTVSCICLGKVCLLAVA